MNSKTLFSKKRNLKVAKKTPEGRKKQKPRRVAKKSFVVLNLSTRARVFFFSPPLTRVPLSASTSHTQKEKTRTSQNASLPIHHRARVHLFSRRCQGHGKEAKSLDGCPCRELRNHRDGCGAQSGRAVLSGHQGASMTTPKVTLLDWISLFISPSLSRERERERRALVSLRQVGSARARSTTGD